MAAPMIRKFFEGIKDDIKDDIAPPKKALIVVAETAAKDAGDTEVVPLDPDQATPSAAASVSKALPVKPLDATEDTSGEAISAGQTNDDPPEKPRAKRAIPVGEDEVIQEGVEEP
jgi:hypothetical protein